MKYVEGDLFNAVDFSFHHVAKGQEVTFIPHVCNNIGAWGAGFVVPLGRHYPVARTAYLEMNERPLGHTLLVVIDDKIVANMIAQDGIGPTFEGDKMIPPIRYDALKTCMIAVREAATIAKNNGKSVRIYCPMFGAGLAGGDWPTIEKLIADIWGEFDTTVFYLPNSLPDGWTPPK